MRKLFWAAGKQYKMAKNFLWGDFGVVIFTPNLFPVIANQKAISGAKAEMRKMGLRAKAATAPRELKNRAKRVIKAMKSTKLIWTGGQTHTSLLYQRAYGKSNEKARKIVQSFSLVFASPPTCRIRFPRKEKKPLFSHNRGKKQHERGRMAEFPRKKERVERGGVWYAWPYSLPRTHWQSASEVLEWSFVLVYVWVVKTWTVHILCMPHSEKPRQ